MAHPDRIAEFKQTFGDAPELTEPFKIGGHSLSLQLVDFHMKGSYPLATFEGIRPIEDENTPKVIVDYAGSLRLRRERVFTRTGQIFVLNSVNIRYNPGPVDIVYFARGPFMVNPYGVDEKNWSLFSRQILIQFAGRPNVPLAMAEYFDSNRSSQYNLYLTYGEFGDLSKVPEIKTGGKDRPTLRFGTADIGVLSGVNIREMSIIGDEIISETPTKLSFVNGAWVDLDGSPYLYKVFHDRGGIDREWGRGRLRFSRIHSKTGSVIALSVPEWLNVDDYMRYMVGDQWNEVLMNHPVRFAVEGSGQPRQWFFTFGKDNEDLESRDSSSGSE